MDILVKHEIGRRIGYKAFRDFGVSETSWKSYERDQVIDLAQLSPDRLSSLEETFKTFKNVRGVGMLLIDIANFRKYLAEGAAQLKARSARQFAQLMERWLLTVPGHRLYKRHEDGAIFAYYVNEVIYHPPYNGRDDARPASVVVEMLWEENANKKRHNVNFVAKECIATGPAAAMVNAGYVPETPELRQAYLEETALWAGTVNLVGRQYLVKGRAQEAKTDRWSRHSDFPLSIDGSPVRVVVDVFTEEGESEDHDDHGSSVDTYFWQRVAGSATYDWEADQVTYLPGPDEEEEEDKDDEDADEEETHKKAVPIDENTADPDYTDLPIHPWVVIFDLARHVRLRVHVNQMALYTYDTKLAEKLILPEDQKAFVKLLVENKLGAFRDIVQGKSGGTIVLLTGMPGVGKTLTAEVYSEAEERPLYSVQCSQLGTDPETLEASLMLVFARARRWNAVLLLDEADVYVHARGNNMAQNAIVGVFLRVLEYQASTLFLTTNRPEDVDDAIASRCIARLNYECPSVEDAIRIWQTLAGNGGVLISEEVITKVVDANRDMTGRDVKNLLKLVRLMPGSESGVTLAMIEYVQQFKPTGSVARRRVPQPQPVEVV